MRDDIQALAKASENYGGLIEKLVDDPTTDAFWLDYALRHRHASGNPIEMELPQRLIEQSLQSLADNDRRREFLLNRAYGGLIQLEPKLVTKDLFGLLADLVARRSNISQQQAAFLMLGLTANQLESIPLAHSHILSVRRTVFGATYHSSLHLFQLPEGLQLMFDGKLGAPAVLAAEWLEEVKKTKANDVTCNGVGYKSQIVPALCGLLEKAVALHEADASLFRGSRPALDAIRHEWRDFVPT